MPTHLQAATIRCLAALRGVEVTVITESGIPNWRLECGWSLPDYGNAQIVIGPSSSEQERLLSSIDCFDVNIFSGVVAYPLIARAFHASLNAPTLRGIMSEGADWRGWRGRLRVVRSSTVLRGAREHVAFILAMGHLGETWHHRIGFPKERIFRYGYFPDAPQPSTPLEITSTRTSVVELVFVGQLVRRKGLDILIRALARLERGGWHLTIVGDGAEKRRFMHDAARLGLADCITFLGAVPNSDAMQVVQRSDLLVLPSRWDGWGAVTNEALLRGVPVVCSDYCGSADLLACGWRGTVVRAGKVESLREALQRWVDLGARSAEERRRISEWSAKIAPEQSAKYVLGVIDSARNGGVPPTAPWLES
jgi:glycosyltransferase involved in cell wall biosynthesis